jgi:UDP-N-acetylmuramoylalanine--D-glutamate ligase
LVRASNFREAFRAAVKEAEKLPKPCAVLLAPACASFDEFRDFEERGEVFTELVREWIK